MAEEKPTYTMDRIARELTLMSQDWFSFNQRMRHFGHKLGEDRTIERIVKEILERDGDIESVLSRWLAQLSEQFINFVDESEARRQKFGNIASLGSPEAWRLLARANNFQVPDLHKDPAIVIAESLVRQHLNLPQLIGAIAEIINKSREESSHEDGD